MLIVKTDGVLVVRELTPEQVEHMQKHPLLYLDRQPEPGSELSQIRCGTSG
jgi:hypothetical protein